MSLNRLAENAIKLNDKLNQLRETLRPAIEAALQKTWRSETERALVKAGKLLGVE